MASQLSLYNDALLLVGERALASLTEEREPRRLLDQVWANGGVKACLEEGQWHFAMRTILVDYDTAITPAFGYARAFVKPTDWVLTSALCSDEYFEAPLLRYVDEAGHWYADEDQLYVRYVSDHADYGGNLAGWPESFKDFVAAHLASKLVLKLAGNEEKLKTTLAIRKQTLALAKSRSAMTGPTQFPAPGSWNQARTLGRSTRRDGGGRGSLIG